MADSGDIESFNSLCAQFNAFAKKHKVAHMTPVNDGTTPNPWKRNMDYSGYESSPYYGSISEFMKKFPGGIRDWIEWRRKTQKERNLMYKPAEPKTKKAHFVPEGPDDTEKFPEESHLWSGEGFDNFESVRDFIKARRKETGQSADDAAYSAVKDFVNYWKLLLKGQKRRGKK